MAVVAVWLTGCSLAVLPISSGLPNPPPAVSIAPTQLPTPGSGPSATPAATLALAPWGPFPITGLQRRPEPDPLLTPGVADPAVSQGNIASTICLPGYSASVRPPSETTTAIKVRQITQYGYADTNTADYEEDHLISLEIGGSPTDPANLWPEPYSATLPDGTPAGARVKDRLEDWLHRSVCAGTLSLAAAQHQEASDWVGSWIAAGRP